MSTETNTVLDSAVTGTAAVPMDVSVNATSEVVAAPKKRGRKPKTEGVVTGTADAVTDTTAAAPKKGVKKSPTESKKKDVEESSEDKPKKKTKKETSEKKDEEENVKETKEKTKKETSEKKDEEENVKETKEKKPRAKKEKSTKEDAKDEVEDDTKNGDSKPKKRARKTSSKTNADGTPKKPRPLSSYMFFFKTIRAKVASENPSLKTTEIGRKLGEMWRALSEDEKKAFKSSELASQPAVPKDVVCCGTQI
jgi:hypothetical protein